MAGFKTKVTPEIENLTEVCKEHTSLDLSLYAKYDVKIGNFFKSISVIFDKSPGQIFDIISSVGKTSRTWNFFAINNLCGFHIRNSLQILHSFCQIIKDR